MNQKMTFETALKKLNEIVEQLESGEVSLDKSLKLFEEGTKLSAFCYEKLQTAEQKVTEISKIENSENTEELNS